MFKSHPADRIGSKEGRPVKTYRFTHPELTRAWHTQAENDEHARKRFEDAWALRTQFGLLERVDGSFFDGEVFVAPYAMPDDLCPRSLEGHMIFEDSRPERREFNSKEGTPVMCILCEGTGWSGGKVSSNKHP